MRFYPFEVSIPHIIYAVLGGFVVFFGMFSLFIREKLYIGEACWAFLFGVVIGPYAANIFDPRSWGSGNEETINTITLEFTRVVLAIGVFAIGVELPKAYMKRHWKRLNFLSSLAVAACLTPTDPILAAAVVGGKYADKHVPAHLRHLLAAESGCNDGAAYPFLFISLYLIIDKDTSHAISDWFLLLWLYQVILGIVVGALIGWGFRHLMKFCERKDLIDRQSYVAQYVSLAMLTIGICSLLGTDDLLAAFSCGTAFAWDGFFNKQTEEAVFSSVIDLLFNIAAFVFVGAWMPFNDFSDPHLTLSVWRLIVIAILVLILRRLPVMIALYKWIPDVKTFREAVFSGHFGPMGVGAIFISTLAAEQLPSPREPPEGQQELLAASIQPIVAFMVLCSITIHGLSIPFFSLGRRVHTVSRTWSRHDTLGRHAMPEWATDIRRVERPEDIVVNRDLDIERGDSALDKTLTRSRRESMTAHGSSSSEAEKDAGESSTSPTQSAEERTPVQEGEGGWDSRQETPREGEETVAEWIEGPHKVIERRAGPGEEVEVEVVTNAPGPGETDRSTLRVAGDAVHDTVHEIRRRLANAPGEVAHAPEAVVHFAEDLERGAEHKVTDIENKAKDVVGVDHETAGAGTSAGHAEEEEEGWMSDREGEASTGGVLRSKHRTSKIKPKLAISRPLSSTPGSRRRPSFRRGVLTGVRPHPGRSASEPAVSDTSHAPILVTPPSEEESDHGRGRRPTPRETRSATPSSPLSPPTPRSLRHARIDSLRSLRPGSRELSPARSIRWADEEERNGVRSPSSPSTPLPGSQVPSDDEGKPDKSDDSPTSQTQVRFDLPDPPAREHR
ncbi:unnamed protein product [Somion occarium]|uniref:Cation/H+ exchanger transmembrane domain-containing protein n=1 Tax=Somion occarium TaxID=3059160 RepID=A0ABP1E045_9APHY